MPLQYFNNKKLSCTKLMRSHSALIIPLTSAYNKSIISMSFVNYWINSSETTFFVSTEKVMHSTSRYTVCPKQNRLRLLFMPINNFMNYWLTHMYVSGLATRGYFKSHPARKFLEPFVYSKFALCHFKYWVWPDVMEKILPLFHNCCPYKFSFALIVCTAKERYNRNNMSLLHEKKKIF